MSLAISLPPAGLPLSEVATFAREAEELGYGSAWVAEVAGNDGFALGCAAATATSRMRIGTAVVPLNTRGPAMLAMAAATLDGVSGGRGVCGIGVSSEAIVSGWNDQGSDRPLRRARETIEVLRAIFAGEKVTYEGETVRVRGYRMTPPPLRPMPIYLGALNRGMLRLAGELADGVVLNMLGEDFVPTALAEVHAGARLAGRDPADIEVVLRAHTYVGDDPAAARDGFARGFAAYVVARGYRDFFAWQGYGECVAGVDAAFAARDREAARRAISDEMLHSMTVTGDAATVRARLQAYQDAGVHTVAVSSFWPDRAHAWETMRVCAPQA